MPGDETLIQQTLNLYGLALDTRRWDLFAAVFTADVRADYGPDGRWDDLETFVDAFARVHERYDHTQHAVSSHVIRVEGDSAAAFSSVAWRLATRSEQGYRGHEGNAWYDDQLVRTHDGWRISNRRCGITWSQPVSSDGRGLGRLATGQLPAEADRLGVLVAGARPVTDAAPPAHAPDASRASAEPRRRPRG